MSLSVAERKDLAEEWCRKAKGKYVLTTGTNQIWTSFFVCCLFIRFQFHRMDQVIIHVGCMSLTDSKELVSCCLWCVLKIII